MFYICLFLKTVIKRIDLDNRKYRLSFYKITLTHWDVGSNALQKWLSIYLRIYRVGSNALQKWLSIYLPIYRVGSNALQKWLWP